MTESLTKRGPNLHRDPPLRKKGPLHSPHRVKRKKPLQVINETADEVPPEAKVEKKGSKAKLPAVEGFPLLVDTFSSEDEVVDWVARKKNMAGRRERKERRRRRRNELEVGVEVVPDAPLAPLSSPSHVHTVRLDSAGQREVTLDIIGYDLDEVFNEIQ